MIVLMPLHQLSAPGTTRTFLVNPVSIVAIEDPGDGGSLIYTSSPQQQEPFEVLESPAEVRLAMDVSVQAMVTGVIDTAADSVDRQIQERVGPRSISRDNR